MSPKEPVVAAAGGVVLRRRKGRVEVLVIHRPRRDDWSLPKGKLDPGERHREAARREVLEETGVEVELHRRVGTTEYRDRRGRRKVVRYWLMTPQRIHDREPDAEVDDVRWWPIRKAVRRLTYRHDRELVLDAAEVLS